MEVSSTKANECNYWLVLFWHATYVYLKLNFSIRICSLNDLVNYCNTRSISLDTQFSGTSLKQG